MNSTASGAMAKDGPLAGEPRHVNAWTMNSLIHCSDYFLGLFHGRVI